MNEFDLTNMQRVVECFNPGVWGVTTCIECERKNERDKDAKQRAEQFVLTNIKGVDALKDQVNTFLRLMECTRRALRVKDKIVINKPAYTSLNSDEIEERIKVFKSLMNAMPRGWYLKKDQDAESIVSIEGWGIKEYLARGLSAFREAGRYLERLKTSDSFWKHRDVSSKIGKDQEAYKIVISKSALCLYFEVQRKTLQDRHLLAVIEERDYNFRSQFRKEILRIAESAISEEERDQQIKQAKERISDRIWNSLLAIIGKSAESSNWVEEGDRIFAKEEWDSKKSSEIIDRLRRKGFLIKEHQYCQQHNLIPLIIEEAGSERFKIGFQPQVIKERIEKALQQDEEEVRAQLKKVSDEHQERRLQLQEARKIQEEQEKLREEAENEQIIKFLNEKLEGEWSVVEDLVVLNQTWNHKGEARDTFNKIKTAVSSYFCIPTWLTDSMRITIGFPRNDLLAHMEFCKRLELDEIEDSEITSVNESLRFHTLSDSSKKILCEKFAIFQSGLDLHKILIFKIVKYQDRLVIVSESIIKSRKARRQDITREDFILIKTMFASSYFIPSSSNLYRGSRERV